MKISNTNFENIDTIKMIIFGESGTGKTTLASTLSGPTLIISAESGLLSLRGKSIDVIDISIDDNGQQIPKENRINRLGEVYKFLLTDEAKNKYKYIFVDSLTEINSNLLEKLNLEFPDRKDSLPMYGELAKKMKSLVKMFRDLPNYSVIFTALSEVDKDENGARFVGIQLIGKFSSQISAYFDEVLYLHIDKETSERKLITEKTDRVMAKDRSGKLAKHEPANLDLIFKKILNVPVKITVPTKEI